MRNDGAKLVLSPVRTHTLHQITYIVVASKHMSGTMGHLHAPGDGASGGNAMVSPQ